MFSLYDPLCGIAIAFAGAYVGLPEFRYKAEVQKLARKRLKNIEETITPLGRKGRSYTMLCHVAESPKYSASSEVDKHQVEEPWYKDYHENYRSGQDRHYVIASGCIAISVIFFGVLFKMFYPGFAHADLVKFLALNEAKPSLFAQNLAWTIRLGILALVMWCVYHPVASVVKGRKCVKKVKEHILILSQEFDPAKNKQQDQADADIDELEKSGKKPRPSAVELPKKN